MENVLLPNRGEPVAIQVCLQIAGADEDFSPAASTPDTRQLFCGDVFSQGPRGNPRDETSFLEVQQGFPRGVYEKRLPVAPTVHQMRAALCPR